jgi:DNA polymerase-3 subunit beta
VTGRRCRCLAYRLTSHVRSYPWSTTEGIHLSADRDDLYAALRKVEPLLGDKPERRYLRVDADDGLRLSTTDREQLITASLNAEVAQPGSVVAYGRFLIEFVRHAPAGKVVLRSEGRELHAEAGGAQIELATFDEELWPQFEHVEGDGVTWTAPTFQQLGRVLHAVSRDDARPILQGVCFRAGWAAATDSYQLASVKLELPEDTDVVIPGAALENVLRVSGDHDVTVRFAQNRVSFVLGDATITSTLLAGQFPQWTSVIPEPQGSVIRANRHALLEALERLTFLALKDDRSCVHIHPDAGGLRIDARLAEVGHQEDRISGENTVGDVCLQVRHLKGLLEQLSGEDVTFDMAGPLKAAVAREDGYTGLLMPIRP